MNNEPIKPNSKDIENFCNLLDLHTKTIFENSRFLFNLKNAGKSQSIFNDCYVSDEEKVITIKNKNYENNY